MNNQVAIVAVLYACSSLMYDLHYCRGRYADFYINDTITFARPGDAKSPIDVPRGRPRKLPSSYG